MRISTALTALTAMLLVGCVTFKAPPPAYVFRIIDDTANKQFVFELSSNDPRPLCISADAWAIISNDTVAGVQTLQTASGPRHAHPYFDTDAGMLCGLSNDPDCGTVRLESNQSLRTEVNYSYFGDPEVLAQDSSKHFDLHKDYPFVKVCDSKR